MVYKPLNPDLPNKRENSVSKRMREQKLQMGNRYEFQRSMYGNVHTIIDHERKVYYRQDREIIEQLNLLDEKLPRYCDYCDSLCDEITLINYELVYKMIVRPNTNPEIKTDVQEVKYASCNDCLDKTNKVPDKFKSGHIHKIYKNGELIWEKSLLHHDGKLTMPWTAI